MHQEEKGNTLPIFKHKIPLNRPFAPRKLLKRCQSTSYIQFQKPYHVLSKYFRCTRTHIPPKHLQFHTVWHAFSLMHKDG